MFKIALALQAEQQRRDDQHQKNGHHHGGRQQIHPFSSRVRKGPTLLHSLPALNRQLGPRHRKRSKENEMGGSHENARYASAYILAQQQKAHESNHEASSKWNPAELHQLPQIAK